MYLRLISYLLLFVMFQTGISQDDPFAQYPHEMLSNGQVEMSVFLPDPDSGFYRSTRFEWSGMVGQLTYKGHTYFVPRNLPHDPTNNEHGMSLAEEFSIGTYKHIPHRYEAAQAGETFVKIGSGILRKPNDGAEYAFYKEYELVKTGEWQVSHGENWIEFIHTLTDTHGLGYIYRKRMALEPDQPELIIESSLTNTGNVLILQDHYNHNFFNIDQTQPGPAYKVELAFTPDTTENTQLPKEGAYLSGNQLVYKQPVDRAFIATLRGYSQAPSDGTITLTNTQTGAGVQISGDFPLYGFKIWTSPKTLCPEIFVQVDIPAGETQQWIRRYRFFEVNP